MSDRGTTVASVVLVKLGGSLLTDKARAETAHGARIARIAREIAAAVAPLDARGERLVVGHGSGSFGHVAAAAAGFGKGPLAPAALVGASRTQERAAALHAQVVEALRQAGTAPFSFAPGSFVVAEGGVVAGGDLAPLAAALQVGFLPVLYGDVVVDRAHRAAICSTEAALSLVARELPALGFGISRALWFGETDGVFDASGRTIPRLGSLDDPTLAGALGGSRGTDVTGGMRLRVETCLALARRGIPSTILDGRSEGSVLAGLLDDGPGGTRIE